MSDSICNGEAGKALNFFPSYIVLIFAVVYVCGHFVEQMMTRRTQARHAEHKWNEFIYFSSSHFPLHT